MFRHRVKTLFCLFALTSLAVFVPGAVKAQEEGQPPPEEVKAGELQSKIEERAAAIKALEIEIAGYQTELTKIGQEKQSLQNEIKVLDLNRKKIAADISVTENKIQKTNLLIEELSDGILDKEQRISDGKSTIAKTLRQLSEYDELSFVAMLLQSSDLGEMWFEIDNLNRLQDSMRDHIITLEIVKDDLHVEKTETEEAKDELSRLRNDLGYKKRVADYNTTEKNKLLSATKNNESNYKKLLDEKTALRDAFEREMLEFESELKLLTDPTSIPEPQTGTLSWPLESIRITQYFGNTAFSRANPQVYSGSGHNGIDFSAPTGTAVKAALGGEVIGTGDTDSVCPDASYGKWVVVKHNNGLSTLYAHFSVIRVSEGQTVSTGDILGYSGNTGYSTGPHLHFTVYATQGMRIMERKSRVCSGTYIMPVADLKAYLNPLIYLPELN